MLEQSMDLAVISAIINGCSLNALSVAIINARNWPAMPLLQIVSRADGKNAVDVITALIVISGMEGDY